MKRKETEIRPFTVRRDRDLIDYLTTLAAIVALIISIVTPVVEHFLRVKVESPRVAVSGWQCRLLDPQENVDVLNALFDASPVWRAVGGGTDITNSVRQNFINGYQYRLFKIKIRNLHNVPVSLSDFRVDSLVNGAPNKELVIGTGQLFAASKAEGAWDTSPIVYIGPYETKLVPVAVGFFAFSAKGESPQTLMPHREIQIKSLCFRARDNLGRDTVSDAIPVREDLITD